MKICLRDTSLQKQFGLAAKCLNFLLFKPKNCFVKHT